MNECSTVAWRPVRRAVGTSALIVGTSGCRGASGAPHDGLLQVTCIVARTEAFVRYGQYGTSRCTHEAIGDAAQQEPVNGSMTVRADDDEINVLLGESKPRIKRLSPEGYAQFIETYMERVLPGLQDDVYEDNARFLRTMRGLHGADAMRDQVSHLLYKSLERTHIYSMSTHGDSEHLWENYAGSHTGYCLEFANAGSFATARHVIYQDPNELNVSGADQAVSNWFYFKTQRWWPEQEVRLVLPTAPKGRGYFYRFRPSELTRTILGDKISMADTEQIVAWARHRNPPLPMASATYDRHGRLVIEDP